MALTISDMTKDATIEDGSVIPFIKDDGVGGYLNRSIEAQDLKTYVQTGITALPPGTAGKVMYYSTAWGKSANFETDGTNVAIGQTVAFKSSRLTIYDGSGSKDYTLFLQNGNTKLVTHKHGTTFIGNYDTNKETSGFGTAIKLYNQGNFYNESDIIVNNTSLIKFASIDNNGTLTETAKIGSAYSGMYLFSKNYYSGLNLYESFIGHNSSTLINGGYEYVGVKQNVSTSKYASFIGVDNQDVNTSTHAGTTIGSSNRTIFGDVAISIINKDTATIVTSEMFMNFMTDGTIKLFNVPTSSAGLASGTMWRDSGTLKIA